MSATALRDQLKQARETAREALSAWGLQNEELKVLRNFQNTTFKVGDAHVLRLSHPGYQSDKAIKSEAVYLEYLTSKSIPVPKPVRAKNNKILLTVNEDRAVVFPFVTGRFASASFGLKKALLHGELVGRFHEAAVAFKPPKDFHRLKFTPDTLLQGKAGDDAAELCYDDIRKFAGKRVADVIDKSAELVRETWQTLGPDYVIHTDITPWNTMWQQDKPFLIDFDDAAWGPLGYDLGVIRMEYNELKSPDALWSAFVEGYTSVRDLPEGLPAGLLGAQAGRTLLFVTWLIHNLEDPQFAASIEMQDFYRNRVTALTHIVKEIRPTTKAATS